MLRGPIWVGFVVTLKALVKFGFVVILRETV